MSGVERVRGRKLQERRRKYFMQHPLCVRCRAKGRIAQATELDHITPLIKGGTDEPSNWQGLCADCHKDKTAEDFGHRVKVRIGLDGLPMP